MNAIKTLLPVLLLVAGVGAWFAFFQGPGVGPPVAPIDHSAETPPPEKLPEPVAVQVPDAPRVDVASPRIEVGSGASSSPDAEQGVIGRVMLPTGGPASGVTMLLLQSTSADPLQLYLMHKKQQKILPVAQTLTGADGRFTLGVNQLDQTYDLRIVSDNFPEKQHKSIKVTAKDWYDTKDIVLEAGGVVQGHVMDENGHFPIAKAQVFLTVPNLNHQMLPTPGRERGIVAETDAVGFFRFNNAPRDGIVTLGAEAPDYAFTEKANLQLKQDTANDFTLELVRGEPIAGVVVDQSGRPIIGAVLVATAQSAKLPQTATATSDSNGRFTLPMMRPGPYQIVAQANNFEDLTEKPVMTGNLEVKLVLTQRGKVRLRVLSSRGSPLKVYNVSLKRYFPNNPGSIGKVPEWRDVRITPADYEGDYANVRNVPNGEFVFQILEGNHAKTLSPPFTMDGAKESPVVEVTLTTGSSVTGIVVDDRGQPVANATVATDMNGGLAADTGFFEMFKSFLPDKHTTSSVKTDGGGRFVINRLAYADYMLRVAHPDFCEGTAVDIKLETEGQMKDVGLITLSRGAVIEGFCSAAGQRMGQIKVTISPPDGFKPETDANGQAKMRFFSASAISDGDGHYRFLKRVPPGTYKIHAYKEAGSEEVFGRFKQMRDTQRPLVINVGQDQISINFDIP